MKLTKTQRIYIKQWDEFEAIRLSFSQLLLLKKIAIKNEPVSTPDIVSMLGCSTQSASARLAKLHQKGWLSRNTRDCETGGKIHDYRFNHSTPNIQLFEEQL